MRKFKVSPLQMAILLHNVIICEDAENDTERTVDDLAADLNNYEMVTKGVLQSALYCCKMNDEAQKFWHPKGWTFTKFVNDLLPKAVTFNHYYCVIHAEKEKA